MSNRMLIDARHPEETRVAVINGQRIEEFDFEAADKRQLKGNIYLAKVTRVEPSLQAAFVEYGGNRHGFLAFSEIHPDYYQIPKEDRDALLREEAELAAEDHGHDGDEGEGDDEVQETGGHHDEPSDALRRKRMALRRRYKIQEVIRRRQVMLIQVVKEERGSKGAALTTYLSLAGRYCVLMPNTAHGGISRKISNPADRKRLKQVMADLHLPSGMGAIVRTAGLKRSAVDIRRDFDYLTRLWDEIREKTLASQAPALIHEDSGLIKRAIRDVYNREIDQVLVEGREGFEAAHRFMSMLMPTHAAKVVEYEGSVPLFQRFGVEDQLEAMYQPVVQLKSGGYLVINPTEALVSIDINSGRSTREYGIEETATKTNLEAADEIGRQLRLRDMAGLVVIDFIDMENGSNVRKVEKAMKEALKNDRARVQIGRISSFGLMEMSRQRLRTGILEASTHVCPMCEGTGMVRSVSSAALAALRALEAEALRGRHSDLVLRASEEVAVYLLNRKRIELAELEELYGVTIVTRPDDSLIGPNFEIDAGGPPPSKKVEMVALPPIVKIAEESDADDADSDDGDDSEEAREERGEDGRRRGRGRRRRGRDGRGRDKGDERTEERGDDQADDQAASDEGDDDGEEAGNEATENTEGGENGGRRKRRRRGRRGRRGGADRQQGEAGDEAAEAAPAAAEPVAEDTAPAKPKRSRRRKGDDAPVIEAEADAAPEAVAVAPEPVAEAEAAKPKRSRRKKAEEAPVAEAAPEPVVETAPEPVAPAEPEPELAPAKPKRSRARKVDAAVAEPEAANDVASAEAAAPAEPAAPARKGWWQRTFGNN
ncbi:Rne/Rng family ribonuclease [Sandarakinorhabdus sp. AAP62]|uniref:Rne/Rng family ribonuclease n=1 Tax=Sandarakinorhabdus sp. AAP62 TaxID=1248916 RepID=UPI0002FAA446|nr:Rne/Rng family ribonuclease [Sandarakinorhabdus sp. AAP62]